jgi:hypothetical protein
LGKEKLASALGSPHVKQQWAKSKRGWRKYQETS